MSSQILKLVPAELRLETTLKCGQSFRWQKIDSENCSTTVFRCSLRNRVVTLEQFPTHITFSSIFSPNSPKPMVDDTKHILHDYLNLKVDLLQLYGHWSERDDHFRHVSGEFLGLRMLRQDPFENLISFICSSNNNIARITQMVQNLCKHYGKAIAVVDGQTYYSFPEVQDLLHAELVDELRQLGFGYRAKFIAATARQLSELPIDFLQDLRSKSYAEAHTALMSFMGVGAKVADCVCLMSLDKHCAVPVDTHVIQIARRDYKLRVKGTSMTKVNYDLIKNYFQDLWGAYAGWAHSVLFTADLTAFRVKVKTDTDSSVTESESQSQLKVKIEPGVELETVMNGTVQHDLLVAPQTEPEVGAALQVRVKLENTSEKTDHEISRELSRHRGTNRVRQDTSTGRERVSRKRVRK